MGEKIVDGLFGEGGILKVRGLLAEGLIGTFCWLAIDGAVAPEVFVPSAVGALAVYFGSRIAAGARNGTS